MTAHVFLKYGVLNYGGTCPDCPPKVYAYDWTCKFHKYARGMVRIFSSTEFPKVWVHVVENLVKIGTSILSTVQHADRYTANYWTGIFLLCLGLFQDMVRPPDIMEFFTPDLQPESPSFTLFGITQEPLRTRTVDLDRAFDIYRHIRVWDRLNWMLMDLQYRIIQYM